MLMNRTDGKEYVLSLSYGKDSLGCLGAIEELGWPLDRIVHAEVWATDTIPADLPPMVEFKAKADAIILERWGIEVEHVCAMTTYERCFYKPITRQAAGFEDRIGLNRGFPYQKGAWCQRDLKVAALNGRRKKTFESDIIYRVMSDKSKRSGEYHGWPMTKGPICQSQLKMEPLPRAKDTVQYLGIASDEPGRFGQLSDTKVSPLVEAGWTEAMCREWCEANDLLSPIYTTATRGGCWFCHNQGIDQLRILRHEYLEYWSLMLKWDSDSPVTFHPDGHTVHDFERRFQLEDCGMLVAGDRKFRWKQLEKLKKNQEGEGCHESESSQ
jgi:3'-phosphoadenosine 5'-phosphosulfate sulfotransferase (PAPS reductase)/FAD synthetase